MAKLWEDGIDYSVEIEKAKAAGQDTTALEAARAAKIAEKYGGIEPTMYGSDQTYSQAVGSGNTGAIANAVNLHSQYTGTSGATEADPYSGTNYHQDAIDAAMRGDWDAVEKYLSLREEKVAAQGGNNRGKSSAQIYAELQDLYGNNVPEYSSQYSSQIDSLLDSILKREEFSYDHTTDPSYQAYEQQYKRLGDRAREDTLGDIAGLTGGYASSWAASAASQAQNDYNQQLSAIIPELREAAYKRYMNEYDMDVTNLGLLQGVDDTAYGRYRDTVADSKWKTEFDYMKERDEVSDTQWKDTFDWNKTVDQWNMDSKKIDQLMTRWQMTGVADEEIAKELGVPVGSTTESYEFNKISSELDARKVALSEKEYDQSQKEANEANANKQTIVDNIIRNTRKNIVQPDPYDADADADYTNAAQYLYNAVYLEGLPINDYFSIGAQAGIPTSVLNSTFDSLYNEAMHEALKEQAGGDVEQDYTYYAALMGQQEDPGAWLNANKYSIPADILEDLQKLLDIDY